MKENTAIKAVKGFVKDNKKEIAVLALYLLLSVMYVLFNKPRAKVYDLTTALDRAIPFTKEFIIFYYSWYAFLVVIILSLYFKDRKGYFKLMVGFSIGITACYIIYTVFQTTVPRPLLLGEDIFTKLTARIYANDRPYNCFPSIHVYTTVYACFVIGEGYFKDKKLFRGISNVLGVLIVLSTLYVKQHVILDAVAGTALAYFLYRLFYKQEGERLFQWLKKLYLSWTMKKKLEI